ncbi:MAG TPA: BamA/TamA family outer membrane protein [Longimicrobiales bacterium]|nr:BamA/TamA family outer membrane protein [Longimicrobiales bacterium]
MVLLGLFIAGPASAQVEPPPPPPQGQEVYVEVVPGAEYAAGSTQRFILGEGYRDIWTRTLTVPVLDVQNFAGGLEPERQGGNQSRTLHFVSGDGREFIFRSVNKWVDGALPGDLRGTALSRVVQDFISATHPGGAFVVWPLQEDLGLLTEDMDLWVMPDDPALGEFRETFAGMLGQLAETSNEGPDDTPGTWGYTKITGSEALLDRLEESPRHRVHTRELLRAKLLDFLVGDTDRGLEDQWRWANEPTDDGFLWRPIARDRDWAFINAQGPVGWLIHQFYEKVTEYDDEMASVQTYTWQDQGLSRRLLVDMDRQEWMAVAEEVRRTISDDAIDEAVRSLPAGMQPGHAEWLADKLRERREGLPGRAEEYYAWLATDVDVRATDRDDRLEVVRHADGSVDVTLYADARELVPVLDDDELEDRLETEPAGETSWSPYYQRTFLPHETDEVRLFLQGGDDVAVLRDADDVAVLRDADGVAVLRDADGVSDGDREDGIIVRVIGGGGDDQLADASSFGPLHVLYDYRGDNEFTRAAGTRVDEVEFDEPEQNGGFFQTQTGDSRVRDWGRSTSPFRPAVDYREGAGLIIGGGPRWTDYGFRTHPYRARVEARALYGTRSGGWGAELNGRFNLENSPVGFEIHARGTQFEAMRFYGYGNHSPSLPADDALILRDEVRLQTSLVVNRENWKASLGPLFVYTNPDPPAAAPVEGVRGMSRMTQLGAALGLSLDRRDDRQIPTRGFRLDVSAAAFPEAWDVPEAFGLNEVEARGYIPLGDVTLAARLGGRHAWGTFPLHAAARIGGGSTLRGHRWERFAGDVAVYGGAEARIPLARVELLSRGRLGVLGLFDAGRVYVDGESPGGWHTGAGAGIWFSTLGYAGTVTWARGEEDRFYLSFGLPF